MSRRRLVVEADGGSRGNPGPAGYGAVVRDAGTGEVLAEVAEAIGTATNNVAEYRGLIAGLRAAAAVDRSAAVEVCMDSKLVIEQMTGRWKIKHPSMRPLAVEASSLAGRFSSVSYRWIPRERNSHADRLANEAMDAAAKGVAWKRRPPSPARSAPPDEVRARTAPGWMSPTTRPTSMLLLRHGETPLSVDRRFSGRGDVELTPRGVAQAEAVAARLVPRRIDAIVASPLRRAQQTADIVATALGAPVELLDPLRETDFGEWEGCTFAEVQERWPDELTAWLSDPSVAPPGGESFASTTRRVRAARDNLVDRFPAQTVVVVTHVTPIKMLVRLALEAPPAALYRMHLDLAALTHVDWYTDGPAVVRSFNDTAHLAS